MLSTFGPDNGTVSEPETGLVFASTEPVSHDMLSLAWLIEARRALPKAKRSGMVDDPNTSDFAVNFANRLVTNWLGGVGAVMRMERLPRWDLERVWDDRTLRRAFQLAGGVPRVELAAANDAVPKTLREGLARELTLAA